MPRPTNVLKALTISRDMKPGLHRDGGGLFLQVTKASAKSWIFRYMIAGKSREMGLGSILNVSLADARVKAEDCRRQIGRGLDPLDARKAEKSATALRDAKSITFAAAADRYVESHRAEWRNAKHAAQWKATIDTYAVPVIGALSVQAIDTDLVLRVLEPIWTTKTETASRVRGRIETVLDWAKVLGLREGENPARWRGHLDHLLSKPSKTRKVVHHAALPYRELPAFMRCLTNVGGVASKALEFTILTAARTGEIIGATFAEFDLAAKVWTVPAERMKAGKEHRVPLSDRAVAIVREFQEFGLSQFVFPGMRVGRPMSNMAMLKVLARMERADLTVHGFRSTFRDWAAERTNFPNEVVEMALAHTIGSDVEAAYRRGDLFDKRRRLMTAWEGYCASSGAVGADVVSLRAV